MFCKKNITAINLIECVTHVTFQIYALQSKLKVNHFRRSLKKYIFLNNIPSRPMRAVGSLYIRNTQACHCVLNNWLPFSSLLREAIFFFILLWKPVFCRKLEQDVITRLRCHQIIFGLVSKWYFFMHMHKKRYDEA